MRWSGKKAKKTIICNECYGYKECGCDCPGGSNSSMQQASLQDLMASHKMDAETDDEYDVGKDW